MASGLPPRSKHVPHQLKWKALRLAVLTAEAFTPWLILGLRRGSQCFRAVRSDSRSD